MCVFVPFAMHWQLTGIPASACFMDQGGAFDYLLQFTRESNGIVTAMLLQGFGTNPATPWLRV